MSAELSSGFDDLNDHLLDTHGMIMKMTPLDIHHYLMTILPNRMPAILESSKANAHCRRLRRY